jgi:hypothetical protein
MNYSTKEIKMTHKKNSIVLTKKSYIKNGIETFFIPIFPKTILKQEIAKNGDKDANIEYKLYIKNVSHFWILNGLQLVIAIVSSLLGPNRLLLFISVLTTLILIISSIFSLRKLKRHLAYSISHYNKNVLSNNPY